MSRLLRPFKREPSPTVSPAAFDIESKKPLSDEQGFERPFMIGLYAKGEYKGFFDVPNLDPKDPERAFKSGGCIHEFFRFLTETPDGRNLQFKSRGKNRPKVILFGHNAGGFDALHLLRWLRKYENARNFDIKIIASGSQLLELQIIERANKAEEEEAPYDDEENGDNTPVKQIRTKQLRKWVFRDSMRLVPGSLDSIGKKLLLQTRKIKMDLSTPVSDHAAWTNYNTADCKTVTDLVEVLHTQLDKLGGHLKMTLPSCAMDLSLIHI